MHLLTPLHSPKSSIWFSVTPLGHNLLEDAGFTGNFTNRSLRVSLVTRCSDDEQLIMSRTGHSSTDGV